MFSNEGKNKMSKDLVEVEGFEQYLHTKFPGAKHFSVESEDASIICLDKVVELSALAGESKAVLGSSALCSSVKFNKSNAKIHIGLYFQNLWAPAHFHRI